MILSDREWLRFVTFGLVAGGALGSTYSGALFLGGHTSLVAIGGGVIAAGVLAAIAHVAIRVLIDRALDPAPPEEPIESDTEADT